MWRKALLIDVYIIYSGTNVSISTEDLKAIFLESLIRLNICLEFNL